MFRTLGTCLPRAIELGFYNAHMLHKLTPTLYRRAQHVTFSHCTWTRLKSDACQSPKSLQYYVVPFVGSMMGGVDLIAR